MLIADTGSCSGVQQQVSWLRWKGCSPLSFSSPVPRFTYATATAVFCTRRLRAVAQSEGEQRCKLQGLCQPGVAASAGNQYDKKALKQLTFRPNVCTDCVCTMHTIHNKPSAISSITATHIKAHRGLASHCSPPS